MMMHFYLNFQIVLILRFCRQRRIWEYISAEFRHNDTTVTSFTPIYENSYVNGAVHYTPAENYVSNRFLNSQKR